MTEPEDGFPTDVPDLSEIGFDDLPGAELDAYREILLDQVERPRINLGSGPPGRVD